MATAMRRQCRHRAVTLIRTSSSWQRDRGGARGLWHWVTTHRLRLTEVLSAELYREFLCAGPAMNEGIDCSLGLQQQGYDWWYCMSCRQTFRVSPSQMAEWKAYFLLDDALTGSLGSLDAACQTLPGESPQ